MLQFAVLKHHVHVDFVPRDEFLQMHFRSVRKCGFDLGSRFPLEEPYRFFEFPVVVAPFYASATGPVGRFQDDGKPQGILVFNVVSRGPMIRVGDVQLPTLFAEFEFVPDFFSGFERDSRKPENVGEARSK